MQRGNIIDLTFCPGANVNHFADIGKMVLNCETTVLTGKLGTLDGIRETTPLGIFQNQLEFASQPVFFAVFVDMLDTLKGLLTVLYKFAYKPSSFRY